MRLRVSTMDVSSDVFIEVRRYVKNVCFEGMGGMMTVGKSRIKLSLNDLNSEYRRLTMIPGIGELPRGLSSIQYTTTEGDVANRSVRITSMLTWPRVRLIRVEIWVDMVNESFILRPPWADDSLGGTGSEEVLETALTPRSAAGGGGVSVCALWVPLCWP